MRIEQIVSESHLNEFAPGGNSASSYYAVTSNFINEFAQQKQEQLQDLIDAGWTKQDLAQSGQEQGQAADIAHFEQVRDSFLKGLKPGFDAYLRGDTQLKDQLGEYWIDNDLPLNQDWEKVYGEPWGDDGLDEGEVVAFPKKHRGDITNMHTCPKCGGDTHGGKYQGHQVQVCIPCKQVYLPPNSGIDQQGNKISEDQLNEYLVKAGMPVKDVLALNLFQDFDPAEGCAAQFPEFAEEPMWKQVVRKYAPIAAALEKQILALNRPLTHSQAEEIDNVWYDGSDAYDDMEIEYLVDIYNRQIATVEAVIAGELQDDDEEFSEGLPKAQDGRYNPDGSKKKQWHQDPRWQQHAKDQENDPKNIYGNLPKKVKEGQEVDVSVVVGKLYDIIDSQEDAIKNADFDRQVQHATIVRDRAVKALNMIKADPSNVDKAWAYLQNGEQGVAEGVDQNKLRDLEDKYDELDYDGNSESDKEQMRFIQQQIRDLKKKQGVTEAAQGILHRVRYQCDDPSGSGIASGHITLHAPDKAAAARYAASDLSKKGKKNVKVLAVTPQKQGVAEGEQDRKRNALWAQITSYEKRAKETKNDIKKQHLLKMADELRGKLTPTTEERLAESLTQLATLIKESK